MSRLPAPSSMSIGGGGLTEWSESQHNARIAASANSLSALKNLKREIPQPASQSDAKRKPLSDRALEYPTKTSLAAGTAAARSNMKPQSLAGMSSGLKQPSVAQSRFGASNGINKGMGPNRHAPSTTTGRVNGRAGHMRSKSQAPRPRTAHGLREEDRYEPPTANGTTTSQPDNPQPLASLPCNKSRISQSFSVLSTIRDSSLTSKFIQLSLEDDYAPGNQAISRPLSRQPSQSSLGSQTSNIPCKRRKDDKNGKVATTSRQASSERA
ncbi:hypothetical protein ACHAPJ_005001 [Fusarium lateritium]